ADTNWANRAGSYGGGLACNNATVSLANVSFVNNVATQYSGGLDASDCVVSGTNVLFQGNQCLVYDGGGTYLEYGNATLRDLTFTSNSAARYGGGLCLYEGVARLTSCHVQDGRAAAGGGIAVDGGVAYVSAATVEVNRATDGGGGILVFSSGVLRGTNLVVRGNDGDSDRDTSGQGGGLLVSGESSVYLYGTNGMSVISSNAGYFGGGAFVSNGLLYVSGKAWIEGNTATNGGGLYVAAGTAEVYNAYVLRNAAAAHGGGAFVCTNSFVGMLNCLVAENRMSPAGWGGGIRNWYGDLDLIGCTIVSNTVGGVECSVGGSTLDMAGCIVYGHALVSVTPGFTVQYSDVEGGYPGTGNYDAEPLLNNDNYHLTAWSPCRDQGWLVMGDRDVDNEARMGNFDTGFDEYIDGDNDNLPDVVETDTGAWADDADMGTDPADDDSDDDGVKDGDEWLADTDPNKAGSFLRITNIYKTGAVWVRWVGGTNATRWFEVAEDFHETNSPDWQIISTEPAPTSGEGFGPDGFTTNCAVYRIRATRFP
ncbi:MAG: hypothetical protein JXQ75_10205, partial [Phycisphaerae bacterium]|nr:hypothetical protein [Phycisphaerae bacterium]